MSQPTLKFPKLTEEEQRWVELAYRKCGDYEALETAVLHFAHRLNEALTDLEKVRELCRTS